MIFFLTRTRHRTSHKGFTLFEMMAAISIIAVITAVVFFDRRGFNKSIQLTNLAYDVALSVREAQVYGIAVKGYVDTIAGTTLFDKGYGINIREVTASVPVTTYDLYVDGSSGQPGDKQIQRAPPDTTSEEVLKQNILGRGYSLSFCGHLRTEINSNTYAYCSDAGNSGVEELSVTFARPDPDAFFVLESNSPNYTGAPFDNTDLDKIRITLRSAGSSAMRHVVVYSNGQIAVCRNEQC